MCVCYLVQYVLHCELAVQSSFIYLFLLFIYLYLLFIYLFIFVSGVFVTWFSMCYIVSPRFCHRFVGYLEEEAVKTYSKCLEVFILLPS